MILIQNFTLIFSASAVQVQVTQAQLAALVALPLVERSDNGGFIIENSDGVKK